MDIYALNDPATQIIAPVAQRAPDRIVLAPARTDTDPRQGDLSNPHSGQSQAGLIAEAMVSGGEPAPDTPAEPERVLKPWGIAMLPEDSRAERDTAQESEAPSSAPAGAEEIT